MQVRKKAIKKDWADTPAMQGVGRAEYQFACLRRFRSTCVETSHFPRKGPRLSERTENLDAKPINEKEVTALDCAAAPKEKPRNFILTTLIQAQMGLGVDGNGTFPAVTIDASWSPGQTEEGWLHSKAFAALCGESSDNPEGCGSIEQFMSTYPPPGPGGVGRRIEEALELIEMELRHAVAYVNDAVVPQVRKESISAMRSMAETLRNLADRVEGVPPSSERPKDPRPWFQSPDCGEISAMSLYSP
jgi:hypothetical protein